MKHFQKHFQFSNHVITCVHLISSADMIIEVAGDYNVVLMVWILLAVFLVMHWCLCQCYIVALNMIWIVFVWLICHCGSSFRLLWLVGASYIIKATAEIIIEHRADSHKHMLLFSWTWIRMLPIYMVTMATILSQFVS